MRNNLHFLYAYISARVGAKRDSHRFQLFYQNDFRDTAIITCKLKAPEFRETLKTRMMFLD
nr:hypothetical protein [Escherichia coli O25b:H4-ST131]